jgi:Tol biopolymer transport system component
LASIGPGQTLTHFRLVEKIGEGGMGVVWRAVDTRLDREVAIKILPGELAQDPERSARFAREARLLASLNHENIAAIHGFDEAGGVSVLVMELVEGEDLRQRLARGALPVEEALDMAAQVARALECAHESGVIHRDLKPGNVKRTPEGKVSVLDFGLAKALESGGPGAGDPSDSPTITSTGTRAGVILGTASYMSPEQARGRPLDKRTDIWSFGCLLFECLTGRQAFEGETTSDTLASILKTEPDWELLPGATPPRVRELLRRCLEKDARNRLRDIGDARLELGAGAAADSGVTGPTLPHPPAAGPATKRRGLAPLLAAALLAGAVLGIAGWIAATQSRTATGGGEGVARLAVSVPRDWTPTGFLKVSPDGRTLVYAANPADAGNVRAPRLFLRRLDDAEPAPVQGTENAGGFCLSPDGRWLVFVAPLSTDSPDRGLFKVPLDGSAPPLRLAVMSRDWRQELVWTAADEIVLITDPPATVIRIPAEGGAAAPPVAVKPVDFDGMFILTAALPDGQHLLGTSPHWGERRWHRRAALLDLNSGEARLLLEDANHPRWSPTGHLLATRHDSLLAVPFDQQRLEVTGGPVAITDGLRTADSYDGAWFDLSETGTLVHLPGGNPGEKRRLHLVSADGSVEPWSEKPRAFYGGLNVAPGGRRFSVTVLNPNALLEIWASETGRPNLQRLIADPENDCLDGVWSPDGVHIAYTLWGQHGDEGIFIREIEAPGASRAVLRGEPADEWEPLSFSPDGSWLLAAHVYLGQTDLVLLKVDLESEQLWESRVIVENAALGSFSPDGNWIAYISWSSGRSEGYVRSFATDGRLGRELPVTTTGAVRVSWHTGTRTPRLMYGKAGRVFSVELRGGTTPTFSEPRPEPGFSAVLPRVVDAEWLPDGRALAILRSEEEKSPDEIRVVLHWFEELERKLAAGR